MCLVLAGSLLFSKYLEAYFEKSLDESIQTAQDYSILVEDPDDDSTNPGKDFKFILCNKFF